MKTKLVRAVQPANIFVPISVYLDVVTVERFVQFAKTSLPVTLSSEMSMLVRAVQPANAPSLAVVIRCGFSIVVSDVHFANALRPKVIAPW